MRRSRRHDARRLVLRTCACFALAALPLATVHADYVADDQEIAAMKAKILKNPPTAETLVATPYPGAKLDANCSADQSATNQGEPMVYCLYTKDPVEKVKAYLNGPGKPGKGVFALADTDNVVENGYVKIADVTQIRYFVSAKKKAEPDPPPAAAAAPAAPAATAASAAPEPAAAPPPSAQQEPDDEASDLGNVVKDTADSVKKLKGLFGH